jgi:CHAD domain-containing protein
VETEAKFIVPGEEAFARLRSVERFGPYERRDEHTKVVHDRYVDTPDHRFYRKQLYVRLRESKQGDILLTIKSLGEPPKGAVHAREEYQVQIPTLTRADWPESEVRTMVEEVAGDQPLADLVGIDQTRTVSSLYDGSRAVAELSLDKVTVQTANEPLTLYELEAELLPEGLPSDLKTLERVFSDEYGLAPQPLTKFERAMTLAEPGKVQHNGKSPSDTPNPHKKKHAASNNHVEPLLESGLAAPTAVVNGSGDAGSPTRNLSADRAPTVPVSTLPTPSNTDTSPQDDTASDDALKATDSSDTALRKIIAAYYKDMTSSEDGTLKGEDPEALHDMRVATRRMRAALRVLGPYLHKDCPARMKRGLKEVAHSLGTVRDLDVLITNAQTFRNTLPEDSRPGVDGLIESWQANRAKARDLLADLLGSKDYKRFKSSVRKFIKQRDPGGPTDALAGGELHPYQVRHIAPSAILGRYEAVRSFEALTPEAESATNANTSPSPIEQLHALRISGKYLRYTLEFFRDILPAEATDLIRDITTMQDQLGQLHDADVASGLVRAYIDKQNKRRKKGAPARDAQDIPPGLAAYLKDREAAVHTIHTDFHSTWASLQSPPWRARLSVVILA